MSSPQRYLHAFFPEYEPETIRIGQITGDASSRTYFRVVTPKKTYILCHDPEFSAWPDERYPFLVVQAIFSENSIPVPAIVGIDLSAGLILLEDCGDTMLQHRAGQNPAASMELYRRVIDSMIAIQSLRGRENELPFNRSFDEEKLLFEFGVFLDKAPVGAFGKAARMTLLREFLKISRLLVRPKLFVLNHRDYHSRNILISNGNPVVIDFQDARMGLPQYDAVSLLRDSYVLLPSTMVQDLQRHHYTGLAERGLTHMSLDEYLYLFDIMAFQRNVKALGTFFAQTLEKGNPMFGRYIEPTLSYLPHYIGAHAELAEAGKIILDTLSERSR